MLMTIAIVLVISSIVCLVVGNRRREVEWFYLGITLSLLAQLLTVFMWF